MAETLKRIKNRIRSVEGVEKLTSAMKMISASKLKLLQKQLAPSGEYFFRLEAMLKNILAAFPGADNEFLRPGSGKQPAAICVFSSDTGLCGNYNNVIINLAERFVRDNTPGGAKLVTVGRKAFRYFKKKNYEVVNSYVELYGRYSDAVSADISKTLTDLFLKGEAGEVYVAYTSFISGSRHKAVIEKIIPVDPVRGQETEYLTEPNISEILRDMLPLYIHARVRHIILNAFASEHAQRVIAMSEASDNAGELKDALVLLRNKLRQAGITTELIEIISSVGVMKG
jgi:F-type H+-transporting ATPase subunit gamma